MYYKIKPIFRRLFIVNRLIMIIAFSFNAFAETATTPKPSITNADLSSFSDLLNEKIYHSKTFSLKGQPKYADDFEHFNYANPNSPKGGTIKLAAIGTFDNFNRYASRGVAEQNSDRLYDSLFIRAEDDITTYYPLIASSIRYSNRYRWAEIDLNPNAQFQDGAPITAEDVEFTFEKFMTEGVPQYRVYYKDVSVKAISPHRIRIELATSDRELLLSFCGSMLVIPKHFWLTHDLSEPLTIPPVGSGPYFISDYKIGEYVNYQRNPNYWAASLPVNKGLYNFDSKRIEYYKDKNIALEAFKAGQFDVINESDPKQWHSQYKGSPFSLGYIIKQEKPIETAVNTRWLAINIQNTLFKNILVRRALTLAFDFEWLNHAFYYNSFKRPSSFFENTVYAAQDMPSNDELKWLTPLKENIPNEVFGSSYQLPQSDGTGFNRENLLNAMTLLNRAGWVIKSGKLVNEKTNQPFVFEMLTYIGSDIKYALPFKQNLARLGITMNISSIDFAQFQRRVSERDYDMIAINYRAMPYPNSNLEIIWGSKYLNSTYNSSGLHSDAIDYLIEQIKKYGDNDQELIPLGRALDRILTHEYAMIPMWYQNQHYYAYWNKFNQPDFQPPYSIGIDSWSFNAVKASMLPKNKAN